MARGVLSLIGHPLALALLALARCAGRLAARHMRFAFVVRVEATLLVHGRRVIGIDQNRVNRLYNAKRGKIPHPAVVAPSLESGLEVTVGKARLLPGPRPAAITATTLAEVAVGDEVEGADVLPVKVSVYPDRKRPCVAHMRVGARNVAILAEALDRILVAAGRVTLALSIGRTRLLGTGPVVVHFAICLLDMSSVVRERDLADMDAVVHTHNRLNPPLDRAVKSDHRHFLADHVGIAQKVAEPG